MKRKLNYIDLFAGAGGLSEGFTACGFNPVAHVEMNPDACLTLKTRACYYYLQKENSLDVYKNYLKKKISRDDLYARIPETVLNTVINETMSSEGMPSLFNKIGKLMKEQHVDNVDLIIGGPPCQAYSLVGRARKGAAMSSDPRNWLFRLYLQVLNEYKPKMFVFENVPGVLTAGNGKYFKEIKEGFEEAGYVLHYRILNSCDFGVLQSRKRVIIIGWQKDLSLSYPDFQTLTYSDGATVKDILDDLPELQPGDVQRNYKEKEINEYLKQSGIRKPGDVLTWHETRILTDRDREIYRIAIKKWNDEKKRLRYTDLPERLCTHKNRKAFLDRFKVVASDLPASQTMTAHICKDGHYFIHPDYNQGRSLSVREAARIQSFPDDFYFEGPRTSAFMQIGNAVPPLMAKVIASELKKELEDFDE